MKNSHRPGSARRVFCLVNKSLQSSLLLAGLLVLMMVGIVQAQSSRSINLVVQVPASTLEGSGSRMYIKLFARPLAQNSGEQEVELQVNSVTPIQGDNSGKSRRYKINVVLPSHITKDKYALLAYVDGGNIVSESDEGAIDLSIAFGKVTLPSRIVSGGRGVARFPVEVSNEGNIAAQDKQRVDVAIVARPAGATDDSEDVVIARAQNESISGLKPGDSRKLYLIAEFPGPLEVKTYRIRAIVDASNSIAESDETNNSDALRDTIGISAPSVDLLADIVSTNLPKGIVVGTKKSITVPVKITNAGNLEFDASQQISLQVVARPASKAMDEKADIVLANQLLTTLDSLTPGKSQLIEVEANVPETLPVDNYMLRAIVDATDIIKEANEANNTALVLDPIKVQAMVLDLAGELVNPKAPKTIIGGTSHTITLPVKISNAGSIGYKPDQKLNVTMLMRPEDARDTKRDVILKRVQNRPIGDLGPGQGFTLTLEGSIPTNLPVGSYKLLVTLETDPKMQEADDSNNTLVYKDPIGIESPFVDLAAGIVSLRPPKAIVAGSDTRLNIPIKVTNEGNIAVEPGKKIQITVAARPASKPEESTNDVVLEKLDDQDIGSLASKTSALFQARVGFPTGLAADDYILAVYVDSQATVTEPDRDNNYATTPVEHAIAIAKPRIDLKAQLVDATLPTTSISGYGPHVKLSVKVTNTGNVHLHPEQKMDIKYVARPVDAKDASKDVVLGSKTSIAMGNLAPGQAQQFDQTVEVPKGLTAGSYIFAAMVDSGSAIQESDEDNNTVITAANNAVAVKAPYIDLTLDLVNPKLPKSTIAGFGPTSDLVMNVTNKGNVPVDAQQTIDLRVVARPADANDDKKDVVVATLANQLVGGLEAGKSRRYQSNITMPAALPAGNYKLIATADPGNAVKDSDRKNNVADTGSATPIGVVAPTTDLAIAIKLPQQSGQVVAGYGPTVGMAATLTNNGNVPLASDQKVNIKFTGSSNGKTIPLATLSERSVGSVSAGDSTEFAAAIDFPAGAEAGDYQVAVTVEPVGTLVETTTANNKATSPAANPIKVVKPHVDLIADIVNPKLPRQMVAGQGDNIQLPVRVSNAGNVSMSSGQSIDISIFARPAGTSGNNDIVLATLESESINSLAPTHSKTFFANITLPASLTSSRYVLGAFIDSGELVKEADESNNRAMTADGLAIDVTAPFIDLAGEVEVLDLPSGVISSDTRVTALVQVENKGNITTSGDQTMDIIIVARPASRFKDDAQDVVLDTLNGQAVAGIGAGATRAYRANLNLSPKQMPTDDYVIVAHIDAGQNISEANESNNFAPMTTGVVQMGERFRVRNMPVPFESDGPQRYDITNLQLVYPNDGGSYPSPDSIMQLKLAITNTYAGYVSQRHGEDQKKVRLADLASVNARFYRSAVRQICAVVAEHLEHNGVPNVTVRPDPTQIDREGDDLRQPGEGSLRLVVETR